MKIMHGFFLGVFLTAASLGALAGKVNVNEADAATLAGLSGIGQARAEAIIAYREEHGPFKVIEDLVNVKGIGPAFIDKNRELITVGKPGKREQKASAE